MLGDASISSAVGLNRQLKRGEAIATSPTDTVRFVIGVVVCGVQHLAMRPTCIIDPVQTA